MARKRKRVIKAEAVMTSTPEPLETTPRPKKKDEEILPELLKEAEALAEMFNQNQGQAFMHKLRAKYLTWDEEKQMYIVNEQACQEEAERRLMK